jgi:glucose-6-phosphate isomerase, archaeal
MLELSERIGFHLMLDTDTSVLASDDGFRYRRATRTVADLAAVLRYPNALPDSTKLYDVFYPETQPEWALEVLSPRHLTFSPVVLPPLTIGGEFVKTAGHYHPAMLGTRYSYPEVYSGVYGRLLLFLQKRDRTAPDTPADCALVELTPGVSVTVPPDYAHVLINPTSETAVMAGLYCTDFKPEYDDVVRHHGLAYYIMQGAGDIVVEVNPHYENAPRLARPSDLTGSAFEPPDDSSVPLWQSFVNQPDRYTFLQDASAAATYFDRFEA